MATEVLICDDDPVVIHILGSILEANGYVVLSTSDRDACLELVRERQQNASLPSVLFLDLLLGSVSGLDVLKELRELLGEQAFPIIMLSANTQAEMLENNNPEEFPDYYLQKPFTNDDVIAVLGELGITA